MDKKEEKDCTVHGPHPHENAYELSGVKNGGPCTVCKICQNK